MSENVDCILPDGQHIQLLPISINSNITSTRSEQEVQSSLQFSKESEDESDSGKEDNDLPELWKPQILVLGPGGMKGFTMIGLLGYIYDHNLGSKIERLVGCSVGAILGLLYVVGYKPWEILQIGCKFNIWPHISTMNIWQSLDNTGLLPSQHLLEPLTQVVMDKCGYIPNMHELYELTHINYTVVAYNTDEEEPFYFDHETDPHLLSVEAATMSASMPFIFQKFLYNGQNYVDGALGGPYPVDKYDDGHTPILGVYLTNNLTSSLNTSSPQKHKNLTHILVDMDKYINATIKQLRKKIIKQSSSACRHLGLTSNIRDITGVTVSMNERVNEYWEGYRKAENLWQEDQVIIVCPTSKDHIPIQPLARESAKSVLSYHPPHQYGVKNEISTSSDTDDNDITSQHGLETFKDAINSTMNNMDEARSITGSIDRAIVHGSRFKKRHQGDKN